MAKLVLTGYGRFGLLAFNLKTNSKEQVAKSK